MQGEDLVETRVADDTGDVCAHCGRVIGQLEQPFICGDDIVCFGCYQAAPSLGTWDGGKAHAEHVFFADSRIRVTQQQVVLGNIVFPLADVRFARMREVPARRFIPLLAALAGLGIGAVGLNRHLDHFDETMLVVGSSLLAVGLLLSLIMRATYLVIIAAHDGEKVAMRSHSRKYVTLVIAAIADAIVRRGQHTDAAPDRVPGVQPTASPSFKLPQASPPLAKASLSR